MKLVETFMQIIVIAAFIGFVVFMFYLFSKSQSVERLTDTQRVAVEITDNLMVSNLTVDYGVFNFTKINQLNLKGDEIVRNCKFGSSVRFTFLPEATQQNLLQLTNWNAELVRTNALYYTLDQKEFFMQHFGYFGPRISVQTIKTDPKGWGGLAQQDTDPKVTLGRNEIIVPIVFSDGKIGFAKMAVVVYDDLLGRITCAIEQIATIASLPTQTIDLPIECKDTNDCRFKIIQRTEGICIQFGDGGDDNTYCRKVPAGINLAGAFDMPYTSVKDTKDWLISVQKAGTSIALTLKAVPTSGGGT